MRINILLSNKYECIINIVNRTTNCRFTVLKRIVISIQRSTGHDGLTIFVVKLHTERVNMDNDYRTIGQEINQIRHL